MPPFRYLAVDGHGDPNSSADHAEAVMALYAVSYAAQFASKKAPNQDYVVAPSEGLWWAEDMDDFASRKKERWDWTMMICRPQWIISERVEESIATVSAKQDLPASVKLRLEELEEGLCVHILHIGPYNDEAPTLDRLHNTFMPANDLQFNGKHHEIYLSDPRRTAPEKLKTVLRQPVRAII